MNYNLSPERIDSYTHDPTFSEFYFRDNLIKSADQVLNINHNGRHYAFSVERLTIRRFSYGDYKRYSDRRFFDNRSFRIALYLYGDNALYKDGKLTSCKENTLLLLSPGRQLSIMPKISPAFSVLEFYFDLIDEDDNPLNISIFEYFRLLTGFSGENNTIYSLSGFEKKELEDRFYKIMEQLNLNSDLIASTLPQSSKNRSYTINQFPSNRLIYDLFVYLCDILRGYSSNNETTLDSVIRFISSNYSEDISISRLAESVNLSKNYFQTLFKSSYGVTVVTYLNRLRIKKASQLLLNTDLNIMEIADRVGVNSPYYFSKLFKSMTGFSPREYRNRQL